MAPQRTHALYVPLAMCLPRPVLVGSNLAPYMRHSIGPIAAMGVQRFGHSKASRMAHPYKRSMPALVASRQPSPSSVHSRASSPLSNLSDESESGADTSSPDGTPPPGGKPPTGTFPSRPARPIPRPLDEEGHLISLGRGKNSILKWSELSKEAYKHAQSVVKNVVMNHLHHSLAFAKQPLDNLQVARKQVVARCPQIGPAYYADAWLVDALIHARLKYTASRWPHHRIPNGDAVVPPEFDDEGMPMAGPSGNAEG